MAKTPTKREVKRLQQAINFSYKQLKPARINDLAAMEQYVTSHYSDNGARKPVPFNLLELAVSIYTQRLSGGKPRAIFTTKHRELYPQNAKLQRGTNHLLEEIDFGKTLADAVQGGFFSMGIIKTGLDQSGPPKEWRGYLHDVMQPFADSILFSNWVHDMTVGVDEKSQFEGDRYTIEMEDAEERWDGPGMKDFHALRDRGGYDDDKTEDISQGLNRSQREYYRDIGEAWDIWDWRKNRVISLAAGDTHDATVTGEYLGVVDWDGPESGPYTKLKFNPVRGNILPLPPVAIWKDMHDLANNIMRKLGRQAQRQKTVYGVAPGAEDDGRTAMQANDGEMVKLRDPKNVSNLTFPGVDTNLLAMLIQTKNSASWLWGNLDALGGLSPQADTLGQDRLLTASSSQRIMKMQITTQDFATEVMRKLSEYLYTDPFIVSPQTKRYGNIEVPMTWTPEDREADFTQYNLELEPYSLQYRSPSEKLEVIKNTIIQLYAPFAQQLAAQGIMLDFEALFKKVSEYGNMPELEEILIYTNPRQSDEGPVADRAMQSPVTSRTNTRVNRPGATSQGKDEAMQTALLGGGQQNSQFSQIQRPTG